MGKAHLIVEALRQAEEEDLAYDRETRVIGPVAKPSPELDAPQPRPSAAPTLLPQRIYD
jgi:hypothetical protein